uniref:RagB/SusD family nutrient uptake outer membrane protein n=1 Tax=uncultured Prevotella sp. TaxID=159272 RepID=UPI00258FFAF1
MMIWGEARTENVMAGQGINNDLNLHNILKENITAMNSYTTWEGFYDVINRCNTVLKYAPGVAEKDPAYTQGDLDATIAEVTALRSLCYFYLIRTFRDVPFSREAFTDDDQKMDLPATPFYEVLDNLIGDLRSVEDMAVKRYPETQPFYQTGRITQDAIRAMLCEMYLW